MKEQHERRNKKMLHTHFLSPMLIIWNPSKSKSIIHVKRKFPILLLLFPFLFHDVGNTNSNWTTWSHPEIRCRRYWSSGQFFSLWQRLSRPLLVPFIQVHSLFSLVSISLLFFWNYNSYSQQQWKKYQTYAIAVDPEQDDKAKTIKMCSFARPHMRAFHCSWWGFFMAFFIWFAIPPLLSQIRITLELTKKEIWTSNITNVAGTIAMRFILGPACDKYGARIPMAAILCFAAIP